MLKAWLSITALLFVVAITARAQTQYLSLTDEAHPENKAKILKGLINRDLIRNDTAYKWYAESEKIYAHPEAAIVNALEKNRDSVNYIVFGGTWCEDTQFILPKFFILQDKAGVSNDRITFFAVDRQKQTSGNLSAAFKILNVPTIIVMKDGKEKGRIVEYGKTGKWDKELADILNQ